MLKLRSYRPSPAMVVATVALVFAVGGTAAAVTISVSKHSISVGDLKKTAPGRLLPQVAFQHGASCPVFPPSFPLTCEQVSLTMPAGGARVLVMADGQIQNDHTSEQALAECEITVDGTTAIGRTPGVGEAGQLTSGPVTNDRDDFTLHWVTAPLKGTHTFAFKCATLTGDPRLEDTYLVAMTVRS